jgi:hypothetical protein
LGHFLQLARAQSSHEWLWCATTQGRQGKHGDVSQIGGDDDVKIWQISEIAGTKSEIGLEIFGPNQNVLEATIKIEGKRT